MLPSYLVLAGAMACVIGGISSAGFTPRPRLTRGALCVGLLLMLAAFGAALSDPAVFSLRVS